MSMSPSTTKIIGFFSLVSALLWIFLSIGAIITSLTIVNDYGNMLQSEYKKIDSGLDELQNKDVLGIPLPSIWTDSIGSVRTGVSRVFTGLSDGITFAKNGLIILPTLVLISQIMPFFLGIEMLKQ